MWTKGFPASLWRAVAGFTIAVLVLPLLGASSVGAASAFAIPAFQAQWEQGEALTPNFWGPLPLAHTGQQEPYIEAPGGQRLVQYFDKARMELTNPATGFVTNGLLATELISGNRQFGDAAFQPFPPANVPVAGDPDNAGPTYAHIKANAAQLLEAAPAAIGASTTRSLSPSGAPGTFAAGGTFPQAKIVGFDGETRHNVPAAFADYRNRAGLLTIGFAVSEPFWSNVRVAGQARDVLMQAFQRRILTYTPANPAAFQVEFGNIGQHYFRWRYETNQGAGGPPSPQAPPATTTPPTSPPTVTNPPPATPPPSPFDGDPPPNDTAPQDGDIPDPDPPADASSGQPPPPAFGLSSVNLSGIGANTASAAFGTNRTACGAVQFRKLGESAWQTVGVPGGNPLADGSCPRQTDFRVRLSGLTAFTRYQVRAVATEAQRPNAQNIRVSAIVPFTTLALAITTTITNTTLTASDVALTVVDGATARMTFTVSQAATVKVRFGGSATLSGAPVVDARNTGGTAFEATLSGLTRNVPTFYQIEMRDLAGFTNTTHPTQFRLARYINIRISEVKILDLHSFGCLLESPSLLYGWTMRYATGIANAQSGAAGAPPRAILLLVIPVALGPEFDGINGTRGTFREDPARDLLVEFTGSASTAGNFHTEGCAPSGPLQSTTLRLNRSQDWRVGTGDIKVTTKDYEITVRVSDSLTIN